MSTLNQLPLLDAAVPAVADLEMPVIYTYTRAQALEDGVLVDVSELAREAGFVWPVALTTAVWALVEDIPRRYRAWQTVEGRLYDVLWMAYCAIRGADHSGTELLYTLLLDHGRRHYLTLKLVTGPGDHGEPVVTIMLPDES
ncbi:MAG TPA: hypothetical protein PKZ84_06550 [Anaerolineae bacterium]|nr:hypothetical protein [Anaerolineae bacterium]HQI83346.1 hypothetical protein [Anaerolineae bacterium]